MWTANEPLPMDCPYCKRPFDIPVVKSGLLSRDVILLVCPGCGLARTETRDETRRQLRVRILGLERMLKELKYRMQRS
jgi:hypothetical protein